MTLKVRVMIVNLRTYSEHIYRTKALLCHHCVFVSVVGLQGA